MKKSTLFFKVMVLLALLVPWTSWGQIALIAGDDGIWGHGPTIYINDEGQISSDGETYSDDITINFDDVQDQNEGNWEFGKEIEPDNLPITVTPSEDGKQVTLAVEEGTKVSDITAVKFHIAALNNGGQRKGWIEFGLVAGKTNISDEESITISINGDSDSKIYDGGTISISVTTTDGTSLVMGTDYQVYIDDNTTAIATEAGLPKNVKGDTEAAYSIVIEGIGDDYCGKTEAKEVTIKKRPITVTLKDSPKLEFKIGDAATNLNAEDYASYFNIQENITDAGLAKNEYAKVSGTFSVNTESAREVDIDTESLSLVDKDNSGFNATNYNITWGGDSGLKVTVSKKDFSDIESGGTISVTQDGKTYDGTAISAPEVKDGETSLGKEAYVVEYYQGDTKLESAPIHAGEYKVVITPTETSDYDTESSITKDFTIKAAEITLTGSVTVEQGESLLESYDIEDLDNDKVDVAYEEGSSAIDGLTLTFKAAVTPTKSGSELTQQPSDNVPNAFNVQKTEGDKDDWLIAISNAETATYKPGDITIKAITITLIVEAKKVDWTNESNAHAEVTVYVNDKGELKYDEDKGYGSSVNITLEDISELAGWSFVLEENPEEDFDVLAVMSGDEVVMEGLSWATLITTDKVINGLQVSSENKNSIYESLTESKSVKVRLEKDGADGYLLITFKQGESTEEPGGDDEDMTWAENKRASITVYVDKSSGQPLKSEPAMDSKGFAIDLAKFEELEGEWSFATTDDNAIIDKDLSALYSFVVFEGDLLLEPQSEFNSESLSSVKVKIENGDNVGYLEINFKTITVIAEDDINKGGDDDNDDEQIDDDKITFVGEATGAKYVIYDGLPHGLGMLEITVDGETKVLKETDGAYDVVYGESEEEPVDAGTYSATITFNEAMGYSGTVILENSVKIEKRPLNISFSFSEPIEEGKVPTLDDAEISLGETSLGEGDYLTDCIDVTFRISNEQNADKKYDVYIEHISITNSTSENNGFNPSNYDITIVCKGGVSVKMEDTDGDGVLNDNDEDFNDDSVGDIAVDDIETVDPDTGEGSTGTFYKKYELYLANKDYLKNNEETREHYASEGLELFSRHNKKTTWAGGSFTIWYEHNGEMNEGGYRIFWSNRADGDYKEVKLDEVSGYYQIRNVNSNVYVKIYYETGFPVANEEITATDVRAYAQANKIVVITPEPTDVQVISMAGAVVATDQVTGQREFANLAEGVYIVRMGETVIKLQVRN